MPHLLGLWAPVPLLLRRQCPSAGPQASISRTQIPSLHCFKVKNWAPGMRILPFLPCQSFFLHFCPRSRTAEQQGTRCLPRETQTAAVVHTLSAQIPEKDISISFPLPTFSLLRVPAPLLPSLEAGAQCSLARHFAGNFGDSPAPTGEGC